MLKWVIYCSLLVIHELPNTKGFQEFSTLIQYRPCSLLGDRRHSTDLCSSIINVQLIGYIHSELTYNVEVTRVDRTGSVNGKHNISLVFANCNEINRLWNVFCCLKIFKLIGNTAFSLILTYQQGLVLWYVGLEFCKPLRSNRR